MAPPGTAIVFPSILKLRRPALIANELLRLSLNAFDSDGGIMKLDECRLESTVKRVLLRLFPGQGPPQARKMGFILCRVHAAETCTVLVAQTKLHRDLGLPSLHTVATCGQVHRDRNDSQGNKIRKTDLV